MEEEEEDESWDVSEDNDLTRVFMRCLCLTDVPGIEETPSRDSASEERDLTMLRRGLSIEGKLKDFVGEELEIEAFCSETCEDRVRVGELLVLCLEMGENLDDSGMTPTPAAESTGTPSNISSLASKAVTIFESSRAAEVVETVVLYSSSSSSSSSFPRAEKWMVMVSLDSDRWTWSLGATAGGCLSVD